MKKLHQGLISKENVKQDSTLDRVHHPASSEILIDQIDDELLRRLSEGKIDRMIKID